MRKALLPLSLLLLAAACGPVKIRNIAGNPAKYHNREVRVNGVVTRSYGIPIGGYYQVNDGTGTLHVLANGPTPPSGSEVSVKGVVTGGVTVMGHNFATTMREREHRLR